MTGGSPLLIICVIICVSPLLIMAFKYTMRDDNLYRRMVDDVILKCLDEDKARVAMGEVHEGTCGTHQSAPKMKWLL